MFEKIFTEGKFEIGCNYWASHAGTAMWNEWDAAVVEEDLARLKDAGIRIVRMFPLWSDFQPIKMHYNFSSREREIRIGEKPLDLTTPEGEAGIDPIMVERFETFCRLAEKYELKLVVGLLTGWMSGRIFTPPALERLNLLSDSEAILWEIKFVRYMVRRFKNEKSILAWDLGNECNCMSDFKKIDLLRWICDISMAIKVEDNTRPVISGMHGIVPGIDTKPSPKEISRDCDVLTTHPYPLFTRHCNTDPLGEMKSVLHATAESLFQADLSGNPCIVEEIGTLGQMVVSDEIGGDYARASCLSSWAHDLRAFLWWCANEQSALTKTPYDWNAVERELGLFKLDKSKKPVCENLGAVQLFIDEFEAEYGALPKRITDAVCVLTRDQDTWGVAYGAFMLAKQAGLDITFAYSEDVIPDADIYLLPSLFGGDITNKYKLEKLYKKVGEGATLYMSNDEMILSDFARISGNVVDTRTTTGFSYDVELPTGGTVKLDASANLRMHSVTSEVICRDENGDPAFTVNKLGCGKVYYCNYPIERIAGTKSGVISGKDAMPLYEFYKAMNLRNPEKCAVSSDPYIGITEHPLSDGRRVLIVINHDKNDRKAEITLCKGKMLEKFKALGSYTEIKENDNGFTVTIEHNNAAYCIISNKME